MKEKSESSMIGDLITAVIDIISEILGAFFAILPKAISFVCWILCGLVIIPCVFVAGHLFPLWSEWGEKNF